MCFLVLYESKVSVMRIEDDGLVGVVGECRKGGCDERACSKGGCGRLLGMECVEREGEGRGLALVEGSDSKQSEMNVQCEQIISTPPPSTAQINTHIHVSTVL